MITKVCVSCRIEMRCEKNDVVLEVVYEDATLNELFSADLWQCQTCNRQVVDGIAHLPFSDRACGEAMYNRLKQSMIAAGHPLFIVHRK